MLITLLPPFLNPTYDIHMLWKSLQFCALYNSFLMAEILFTVYIQDRAELSYRLVQAAA